MSTATIAAGPGAVRPLSAIKADMANQLAAQPQAVYADIKSAVMWLPKKVAAATLRAARFLHIPQFAAFVRTNFSKFLGVVGMGAFTVEVLTSNWGHRVIYHAWRLTRWAIRTAIKIPWKIVTSPLRLFTPSRNAVVKVEEWVGKQELKGQIARKALADNVYPYVSPETPQMKIPRITAFAVMSVRMTRRFVAPGWLRVLAYILDGLIISNAYKETVAPTWLGKKIWKQATLVEADLVRQGETVVAEATHMTRAAASSVATKLREEAAETETSGVEEAAAKANDLRAQADAVEATAERLSAAETATQVTEAMQTAQEGTVAATATVLRERPTPGPAPTSGPTVPPHKGGGKPGKRR